MTRTPASTLGHMRVVIDASVLGYRRGDVVEVDGRDKRVLDAIEGGYAHEATDADEVTVDPETIDEQGDVTVNPLGSEALADERQTKAKAAARTAKATT